MITCKLDPDVVRWGLHHLYIHPASNAGPHSCTQYDADLSHHAFIHESYSEKADVQSDEVIARALQEELSKVATAEASKSSDIQEQQLQASILSQDWRVSLQRAKSTNSQVDVDGVGISGPVELNRDSFIEPPEMTLECSLDGEVGKRLNQMVPVPHVPRINSQIPSEDAAESDHQRLLDRLEVYDLVELKVKGDGNCQFRALSDQLYRSTEHHGYVRKQIVEQLKSYPDLYEGYVPMPYADYLKKMSKNSEWGDHVTLQAAADTAVLEGYGDASWISSADENKSTSGWVLTLAGGAISWASKKQTGITHSTMESEFVVLAAAGKEVEWLRNFLLDIKLWPQPMPTISVFCDSVATMSRAYNKIYNGKSRHISLRYALFWSQLDKEFSG